MITHPPDSPAQSSAGVRAIVRLAQAAVCVSAVVLVIASPLLYFLQPAYVEQQYHRPGFPPSWRFSDGERLRLSHPVLLYLQGRAPLAGISDLRTEEGAPAFRSEEVSHLIDVARVLGLFRIVGLAALAMLVGVFCGMGLRGEWRALSAALDGAAAVVAGLAILILLTSLLDFDSFFTRFHRVFFREGSWLFYEEDTLIQLYPLPLWISIVREYVLAIALEIALVLGLAHLFVPIGRHRKR